MSTLKKYKNLENGVFRRFSAWIAAVFSSMFKSIGKLVKAGSQKITIMFVPHTEKKIFNVQMSFFGLFGIILTVAGIVFAFAVFSAGYSSSAQAISEKSESLRDAQANVDEMREVTADVMKSAQRFEAAVSSMFLKIGLGTDTADDRQGTDLENFLEMTEQAEGSIREVSELKELAAYFERTVPQIKELTDYITSHNMIMSEIPSLWPIKGGIGHISMYFGQNINPFTGQWYIHRGIDLSTFRSGDPVVATADGKVVGIGYDIGYGNFVILQHKHGFYTRYAHMSGFAVEKGQKVSQGQTIGFIGSTGLSTGPHLHYEVCLGTDLIDPYTFLNLKSAQSGIGLK